MEEWSELLFLDEVDGEDIAPVFFIYDRTAALEENGNPAEAILYPSLNEEPESEDTLITPQVTLIVQLIGIINKLEQEIARALPVEYNLAKTKFVFLHVGKYTLSLKRPTSYPSHTAKGELDMIYYIFNTFYGGFSTANIHTTNKTTQLLKQGIAWVNPDNSKATNVAQLLQLLSKMNRPQLAACVGSWSQTTTYQTETSKSTAKQKLARELAMLMESLAINNSVLGALAMHNGKVVITKNLTSKFVQALTLILSISDMSDFGTDIEFNVNNVSAIMCYNITTEHLISANSKEDESDKPFALIHINGDVSVTLVVEGLVDSLEGDGFHMLWYKPCTKIKNRLLEIAHDPRYIDQSTPVFRKDASKPFQHLLRLHKPSNAVYATSPTPTPTAGLNIASPAGLDWYEKSVTIAQQAFSDMPSISEIRLSNPSDYVLVATQDTVNNTFVGFAESHDVWQKTQSSS